VKRVAAILVAIVMTVLLYAAIAWLARSIDIPADVPTAQMSWLAPSRVVATIGFLLASVGRMPHLAGDFLAAIFLGAVLGATFALSRHIVR